MKRELEYHGGPILGAVEVAPIYWGAAWSDGAQAKLAADMEQFFDFILKSPLMEMLSEYSAPANRIRHGRRLASVYLSDSEPGTLTPSGRQLADEEVQEALQSWIAGGTVAATTQNTLYFVFLPPQVNSLGYYFQPSVGGKFYGYHANAGNVYYVVVPYISSAESIYPGTTLDTLTAISSRELCAAIINPGLDGWFDSSNKEIGDFCRHKTDRVGGYLVHLVWSNKQKTCGFQPVCLASKDSRTASCKPEPAKRTKSKVHGRTGDVMMIIGKGNLVPLTPVGLFIED